MAYQVTFKASALKSLESIPKQTRRRLFDTAAKLHDEPRPGGAIKLKGSALWRIRVGDYRILYLIDDDKGKVDVQIIAHRREVYRDL
jgi:mRNA interferase RelE/StbE